jgi:hypothetical protein
MGDIIIILELQLPLLLFFFFFFFEFIRIPIKKRSITNMVANIDIITVRVFYCPTTFLKIQCVPKKRTTPRLQLNGRTRGINLFRV